MPKILSRVTSPTALLYLFVAVTQLSSGFYLSLGGEPPPAYLLLYSVGFLWIMGWWLQQDSRKRSVAWVLDMGLFLYIAWPIILPYYLVKTRGLRGLLYVLAFAGIYVGAFVIGVVVCTLLIS
jgi:hypothetical protein